jgi:hypothetical protein
MKERIFIALLTYGDSVNVSFLSWIDSIRMLNSDPSHPRTYEVMYIPGRRPVAYARNVAATKFIKSGADRLWFIDDDLVPTESSMKIFESDADIVSGLYYLLFVDDGKPSIKPSIYYKNIGGFSHIDIRQRMIGQDIIPIDAAGTGTLLIKRRLMLDETILNSSEYINASGENSILSKDDELPYFRTIYKADAKEELSEDLDFVWRAKQLGYRCECVLDARFYHKKDVLIDWFI